MAVFFLSMLPLFWCYFSVKGENYGIISPPTLGAIPFSMHNVRLDPKSLFGIAQQRNLVNQSPSPNSTIRCLISLYSLGIFAFS